MEDFKIKKALKNNFDDYEISPKEELFQKISDKVFDAYNADEQTNRYRIAKYFALTILLFTFGTVMYFTDFEQNNISKEVSETANFNEKANFPKAINAETKKEITVVYKANNSTNSSKKTVENIENEALVPFSEISNNENLNNKNLDKNIPQSQTTRIANFSKTYETKTKVKFESNNQSNKFRSDQLSENVALQNKSENKNSAVDFKKEFNNESINNVTEINSEIFSNNIVSTKNNSNSSDLLNSKPLSFIDNPLNKRELSIKIKNKTPKKELPIINKTTPLALEFSVNPFYAFQKIEPTAAGLANIQNISTGKIGTKQRLGLALNAGYVINWTKQSRLRLGVSYRDIFQKVGYEVATDTYELQTINGNQTVLVRKGIPYSEEKRNQLIGIKADRQFFLQLSTPTRFYASLGAEYTKALKSKTQMLFVNTTMGIDCPIGLKTKLQIEPSYSYALLGTTDALKNLNINPNHIGLKVGILYEIRK